MTTCLSIYIYYLLGSSWSECLAYCELIKLLSKSTKHRSVQSSLMIKCSPSSGQSAFSDSDKVQAGMDHSSSSWKSYCHQLLQEPTDLDSCSSLVGLSFQVCVVDMFPPETMDTNGTPSSSPSPPIVIQDTW